MSLVDLTVATFSEKGRKAANEDRIYLCTEKANTNIKMKYFIIADGVGTSQRGYSAADEAIKAINEALEPLMHEKKLGNNRLNNTAQKAILTANERIMAENRKYFGKNKTKYDSTTIDLCTFYNGMLQVTHVGDSRVYILRKDGETFEKITEDENKARILGKKEGLTPDQQKVHPKSKQVYNVVGSDDFELKSAYPQIRIKEIGVIFAATDGLCACLTEYEIKQILQNLYKLPRIDTVKDKLLETFHKYTENPNSMVPIWISCNEIKEERIARLNLTEDDKTGLILINRGL